MICDLWFQVLYLPNQTRYTRASLATKKDRLEAMEKRLEVNRNHMQREAKRAGKIEKKIKTLTWGYQDRAQKELKKFMDTMDQIEENNLRKSTFEFLRDLENIAIPKRIEVRTAHD